MYVSLYNLIYTYSFVLLLCTLLLRDFSPSYTIKSRQEGKIKKQRMFVKCWPAPPPAPLPVSSTCDWLPPTDFWSALWPLSTSTIIPSSALLVKPPPPHSRASPRVAPRCHSAVWCRHMQMPPLSMWVIPLWAARRDTDRLSRSAMPLDFVYEDEKHQIFTASAATSTISNQERGKASRPDSRAAPVSHPDAEVRGGRRRSVSLLSFNQKQENML